ncbi:MAG: MnhB domain-containing protein [Candidatus Verstraetearchaeota archaeon]|nr:MnhB domain-containing protein [Candidatus Verstraetearchaeota archaeon]
MEIKELRGLRGVVAAVALLIIFVGVISSFIQLEGNVARGISEEYNKLAYRMAPNNLASWLYDYRGFDTLIETGVIYVGAVVSVMVIGRGLVGLKGMREEEEVAAAPPIALKTETMPVLLKYFALPVVILLLAYGLLVVTSASTSGGGGFQCGVIISSAYLLSVVAYGRRSPLNMRKKALVAFGALGWGLYTLIGLPGYLTTNFWQYNVGADLWSGLPSFPAAVPEAFRQIFGEPFKLALHLEEGVYYATSGILPIINVAEAFNVIGAICLIFFAFVYGWSDSAEGVEK